MSCRELCDTMRPGSAHRFQPQVALAVAHSGFLGLCREQGVRFEQRKFQLAEGLGLKGFEGENHSELLLSVKITVREKYFKVRHVRDFFAEAGTML